VEIGEGSAVLLQDAPRTLELRAGGIALSREDTVKARCSTLQGGLRLVISG
jgi:hypothetical protein